MRNSKRIAAGLMVLSGLVYFASAGFAVTAERGEFITLGRAVENENGETVLAEEKVNLYAGPGIDVKQAELKSGIVVQILQKVSLQTGNFYNISTVGEEGGIMGWVAEEYIYEITAAPEL